MPRITSYPLTLRPEIPHDHEYLNPDLIGENRPFGVDNPLTGLHEYFKIKRRIDTAGSNPVFARLQISKIFAEVVPQEIIVQFCSQRTSQIQDAIPVGILIQGEVTTR